MSNLVEIPFHDQTLLATLSEGMPYVAMRPICDNLGVNWAGQLQRIKRHPVLQSVMCTMHTTGRDSKEYKMLMLPIRFINGWLFGIDANRVKPEIKDRLVDYQKECFDVLFKHFSSTQYGLKELPEPPTITKAQQGELFNLVGNKADSSDKPHAYFWSRFNKHFKLASYKNLPAEQFDEAMDYMRKLEGDGDDSLVTITRKDFQQLCEMATKPKPITLMIGNAQEGERYLITSQGGRILFQEIAPEAHILTSEQIENNIHDVVPGKELISADLYNKMKGELLA